MRVRKIKDLPLKDIFEEENEGVIRKETPPETDLLKVERSKVRIKPRSTFVFGPQKFLQPISYHIIYGDMAIFDHINPDDYLEKGITSILNFVKEVKEIIIDSTQKKLSVILNDRVESNFSNWRLLVSRLRSLSDKDACHLGQLVEAYSLQIEEQMKSKSNEVALPLNTTEITDAQQRDYDEALRQFIITNKIKYYVAWEFRRNNISGVNRASKFHIDEMLANILGYSLEELYFQTLRKGVPEIFCASQYYDFWCQSPLFTDFIEKSNLRLEVDLLDCNGELIPAYVGRHHTFMMNMGDTSIFTLLVCIEFDPLVMQRISSKRERKLGKLTKTDEETLNYNIKCCSRMIHKVIY